MSPAGNSRALRNLVVVPRRDLGLEFVNTVAWRGSTPAESLHRVSDVFDWLGSTKALPARAVAALRKWLGAHPRENATVFSEVIEIRETLYRLFHAVAAGSSPARKDLRRLSEALRQASPRVQLERVNGGLGWRIEAQPTAAGMLAPALWSAADLLAGPDCARIRECANERCLWLFLDESKNRTRRWCSMQACGNRAKAHRHYLRRKAK